MGSAVSQVSSILAGISMHSGPSPSLQRFLQQSGQLLQPVCSGVLRVHYMREIPSTPELLSPNTPLPKFCTARAFVWLHAFSYQVEAGFLRFWVRACMALVTAALAVCRASHKPLSYRVSDPAAPAADLSDSGGGGRHPAGSDPCSDAEKT